MDAIEKRISPLIEQMFPTIYREEGPVFIAFVKAYFQWLEEEGRTLYYLRNKLEMQDIDETIDDFVVHFRNKYLAGLPLDARTDARTLVKHSLDVYRSKGTERGIDLLFKLVFGVTPTFYYPDEDVFRLDDNRWVVPRYLEVSLSDDNVLLHGKEIYGLKSGAVAFVDRGVRRTISGELVDVFYISAINGSFQTGEKIAPSDGSLSVNRCPSIIGSLTEIAVPVNGVGTDFAVGDIVNVTGSLKGRGAKARVVAVSNITGIITFESFDGGFGYSNTANALISEAVATVSNVSVNSSYQYYWQLFETITQPKAAMNYRSANGSFAVGQYVTTYHANGSARGIGEIYSISTTNSTSGTLSVIVRSGNLNANQFYNNANAVTANLTVSNGYYDMTGTANIMAVASNVIINVINATSNFSLNESVVCVDTANVIIANGNVLDLSQAASNAALTLTDFNGVFRTGYTIIGLTSNARANVQTSTIDIALINVSNTVNALANNLIFGPRSGSNGTITSIATGTGASLSFNPNNMLYVETANINTDLVRNFFSVSLNTTAYGFTGNATANGNAVISTALSWSTINVGTIYTLTSLSGGTGYSKKPYIRIYDQKAAGQGRQDLDLSVTGSGNFLVGEEVSQTSSNAKGIVLFSNSSLLKIRQLSLVNDWVVTANANSTVVGVSTAATANITYISADTNSEVAGFNFEANTALNNGNGAITEVEVFDSGFGFVENEDVTMSKDDNSAAGRAHLLTHGEAEGYFFNKRSFADADKYFYDGVYYQEYSYEIRSPLALDKYKDLMKQVMHVIGFNMFGALYHTAQANTVISIQNASVTIS